MFSASCGVPPVVSTSTAWANVTVASIGSARSNVSPRIGEARATPLTTVASSVAVAAAPLPPPPENETLGADV